MSQANPTDAEADKYASHYVLHGCQTSAFRATFPDSKAKAEHIHTKASLLHGTTKVQQRISELSAQVREVAEKEFKIDAAWVLRRAVKINDMCMQAEPVLVGGEPTGEYKFDSAGANKSLDTIGKHINVQAFNENVSVKTGGDICPWGEIKAGIDK